MPHHAMLLRYRKLSQSWQTVPADPGPGDAAGIGAVLSMFAKCLTAGPRRLNSETADHLWRTGHFAGIMARALGWGVDRATMISLAAPLHDIGKLAVPGDILDKPGPLTPRETAVMQRHTVIGHQKLAGCQHPVLRCAAVIALTHHERWDGTGYPCGLAGTDIPIEGRIVGLIDTYDALRMERCYKAALSHDEALETILYGDGRTRPHHFDPDLLALLGEVHDQLDMIYASNGLSAEQSWPQDGASGSPWLQ